MERTLVVKAVPQQEKMAFGHLLLLCAVGSAGIFFGTANPVGHLPFIILLYPMALYVLALYSDAPFRYGWLSGVPGASAALYWIAVAAHTYGDFPWILAIPCSVALGAYVALWGGIFSWSIARLKMVSVWRRCLIAGVLWYLLEWIRGWFCTGFSWLTLSSGMAAWPLFIQPVSIVGEYGYSGVLACTACVCVEGLFDRKDTAERPYLAWASVCGILMFVVGFGFWRMSALPSVWQKEGIPLSIALVQGNIRQDVKWSSEYQMATLSQYMRLSTEALQKQPRTDLLLWPETAMPFYYGHARQDEALRNFVQELGIPLIFGAPGFERQPDGKAMLFNRAFFLRPHGDAGFYDKVHLVPFGEYLPPVLDWKIFESLLQGLGGFTAGRDSKVFSLPLPASNEQKTGKNVHLGMLVCYEAIFPELARQRVTDGAEVLLNISNDAWYDDTSAPVQHLQLSLLRAVEQGRYVARATNTGITACIDPLGKLQRMESQQKQWSLFESGVLHGSVLALQGHTLYFYLHPWLPILMLISFAALCWPYTGFRRSKPGGTRK